MWVSTCWLANSEEASSRIGEKDQTGHGAKPSDQPVAIGSLAGSENEIYVAELLNGRAQKLFLHPAK
jgi:hypothetical protein